MKTYLHTGSFVLIGLMLAVESQAGLLMTLNNTTDGIVIDNDRSDWASLTAYADDSAGEAGIGAFDVDWNRITIANSSDQGTYYVRYELNGNGADINNFGGLFNMFIDTDQDRGSGYIGGGSQLPIGAEYLIQGFSVYSFGGGGDQTAFSWNFVTSLTGDNSLANVDISYAIPATALGGPTDFNFVLLGDNGLNGNTPDYYPDNGNQGVNGDYLGYSIVPEPATGALLIAGAVMLLARRRRV